WKTKLLPLLSITVPACARPVSPEMMPPALFSPLSSVAPVTRVSWSAWVRRTPMSVMRLSPSV
ncbi:hypothetical protein BGZ91_008267, partial [Linnemannia elongata]